MPLIRQENPIGGIRGVNGYPKSTSKSISVSFRLFRYGNLDMDTGNSDIRC